MKKFLTAFSFLLILNFSFFSQEIQKNDEVEKKETDVSQTHKHPIIYSLGDIFFKPKQWQSLINIDYEAIVSIKESIVGIRDDYTRLYSTNIGYSLGLLDSLTLSISLNVLISGTVDTYFFTGEDKQSITIDRGPQGLFIESSYRVLPDLLSHWIIIEPSVSFGYAFPGSDQSDIKSGGHLVTGSLLLGKKFNPLISLSFEFDGTYLFETNLNNGTRQNNSYALSLGPVMQITGTIHLMLGFNYRFLGNVTVTNQFLTIKTSTLGIPFFFTRLGIPIANFLYLEISYEFAIKVSDDITINDVPFDYKFFPGHRFESQISFLF